MPKWAIRVLGYIILTVLLLLSGLVALATLLPPPKPVIQSAPSNLILDRNGRLLYEWVNPKGSQYRPVSLQDIATPCIQATIATEDTRFYAHPGIDPVAIVRSLYRHLRYKEPLVGASTLTQQLVRLTRLQPEERYRRTLWRKLKEAWLAFRLERHLTKDEILAEYLNHAYYGNFAVGIEAAAHAYFGQRARTLDLAQCALLAGLPQAPAQWNPLVHTYEAKARQRIVLQRMRAEGMISAKEAEQAYNEPLAFAATPFPITAPHFVAMVQNEVEETLGIQRVQAGGLVITTTLDIHLQQRAEAVLRRQLYVLNHDPKAPPDRVVTSGAVVVISPRTGDILALVGSPNYFDSPNAGAVNGALVLRQPGSAIKPVVYAAAFDPTLREPWGPATLILDEKTFFPAPGGGVYTPKNYDLKWHGIVPARVALAASFNIPAVKALQHVGMSHFLALADRLGLVSLKNAPGYGLALGLGAGEVSLLELTRAYAIFARNGQNVKVRRILDVRTLDGQKLWDGGVTTEPAAVLLDPRVAYLVTDILSDRYARVPTFGLNSPLELDRPAAVKTGTTTDWRDAWTVGYTPDIVTGVWVGNWNNRPMEHLSGSVAAGPIWHAIMTFAHRGIPVHPFVQPRGIETIALCADTGLPAEGDCPVQKEELAIAGIPFAPAESPAVEELARLQAQQMAPTPTAAVVQGPGNPTVPHPLPSLLVSPEPEARFVLTPGLPASEQAAALEVRVPPGSRVEFWVDQTRVGERNAPPYRLWWPLEEGKHRARFEIRLPNGSSKTITSVFEVVGMSTP